jgi:hypothetical protein
MQVNRELVTACHAFCTEVEAEFNRAAVIPAVGIVSGLLRAVVGTIQALAGVVLLGVAKVAMALVKDKEAKAEWRLLMTLGAIHLVHGGGNVIRGLAESILGITTAGIATKYLNEHSPEWWTEFMEGKMDLPACSGPYQPQIPYPPEEKITVLGSNDSDGEETPCADEQEPLAKSFKGIEAMYSNLSCLMSNRGD